MILDDKFEEFARNGRPNVHDDIRDDKDMVLVIGSVDCSAWSPTRSI